MQPDEARDALRVVRERLDSLEQAILPRAENSAFHAHLLLELTEAREATERAIKIFQEKLLLADG